MLKQMVKNHRTFIGLPGAYAGTEVVVMPPAELEEKLAKAREDTTGEVAALLQTIAAYRPDWFPPVVYRFEVGNNQRWCVGWPTPTTEDKHPPLYEDCNDLREGLRSLLAQVREAARPAPAPECEPKPASKTARYNIIGGETIYCSSGAETQLTLRSVGRPLDLAGVTQIEVRVPAVCEAAKPAPKPVEGMTIEECAAECGRIMLQRDPREREHWCASPPAGLRHFWNVCYGVSRFGEGDSCLAAWQAAVRKLREEGS